MNSSFELLFNYAVFSMKFLMKLFKKQVFMRYVSKFSTNVIRFHLENTLNTYTKQN